MAILALFGAGRILLHLLAALGDGCFRFHAAGIMRELSRLATAAAQLTRMAALFVSALVLYLGNRIKSSASAKAARATKALPEGDAR
jgi:hypothetical protein